LNNKVVAFIKLSGIILALSICISVRATQSPSTAVVRITVHDASDKPLVGVTAELKLKGTVVGTATSDEKGEVLFRSVAPGTYQVALSKDGFEPDSQDNLVVEPGVPIEIAFALSPKVNISEVVNVKPDADPASEAGTVAPSQLEPSQLKNVPTRPATVADALPLVPGVIRTPQGELKISGSSENRSALVVNSLDATDPATGQFGVTVPVDSVQSVSVFQTPYLAEFGRFTAGVVAVETRRGGDKWNFELNDPLPDFRILGGHLRGIRDTTPRVVFNGPLIPHKLYFSEGFEYLLKKTPVKTLAFPDNETKKEGVNSFTQLDYIVSNSQTVTGTMHVAPWHSNFVNLDFFNPQPVTPAFRATDYTGAVTDRLSLGGNLLESTLGIKMFSGSVWAQGQQEMTLTPIGNLGNYFSQQNRDGSRVEWLETYSFAPIKAYGTHNVKLGTSLTRTTNDGQFLASPVNIEDATGLLLKRIQFVDVALRLTVHIRKKQLAPIIQIPPASQLELSIPRLAPASEDDGILSGDYLWVDDDAPVRVALQVVRPNAKAVGNLSVYLDIPCRAVGRKIPDGLSAVDEHEIASRPVGNVQKQARPVDNLSARPKSRNELFGILGE